MLTNDEKITLLTQAGMSVEDAQEQVLGAAPDVIEEADEPVLVLDEVDPLSGKWLEAVKQASGGEVLGPVDIEAMLASAQESEFDVAVRKIVGKCYADKARALQMCEEHGKAWFDSRKYSKVQAAVAGVDRSAHNKALWAEAQAMVTTLKRMVRDHYRVNSVKAKIAASKGALPQAVRDLDDNALERLLASEEFLALARKHTESA
jgi:hypothetical protein